MRPMAYRDPRTGLDIIERDECFELLASRDVGRLAVVVGSQPIVLPVNYYVADDQIVFRTDAGTKLEAATRSPVALEIDEVDLATHTGWSVLVQGRGEEITEFHDRHTRELSALPLHPWAEGDKDHWVRIVPTSVTGRRLVAPS
jgi:uncharacterized protein